jgi:hypothetical protein
MSESVGNPAAVTCGCRRPKIRLARTLKGRAIELLLCTECDAGKGPQTGPPVLIDYLKRGHQ